MGITSLLGVFGLVARYVYQGLPDLELLEDGRSEVDPAVQAALVGFLLCSVLLVVAWFRSPRPGRRSGATPPFPSIIGGIVLGVLFWLFTLPDLDDPSYAHIPWWWDGFVWVTGCAAVGWTLGVWTGGEETQDDSEESESESDFPMPVSLTEVYRESPSPRTLVERPRVRLVWFAGWLTNGLFWVAILVWPGFALTADPGWEVWLGVGFALMSGAVGLPALWWGIEANEHVVVVRNSYRRHIIPWSLLDDIELEAVPAEMSLGFYRMVFLTSGRRIVADAHTGRPDPGGKLFELGQTLIAMRNRYAAS
jgi:hypothetical protein